MMRLLARWRRIFTALLLTSSLIGMCIQQLRHRDVNEVTGNTNANDTYRGNWAKRDSPSVSSVVTSAGSCNQSEGVCDNECLRFRQWLNGMPAEKPRAVIYYLVQKSTIHKLNISLRYLDSNFNDRFDYPVVIFVESELDNDKGRQIIRSFTTTPQRIFIQVVQFTIPSFITSPVPRRAGNGKLVGYRHMCRFHAVTVYRQAIMNAVSAIEYAWRLDDDSFLYRPITYDLFAFMRDRRLLYGYMQIRDEAPSLVRGLWETAHEYIRAAGGDLPEFYTTWKHTKIYYTNFEISAMSVWMSEKYCQLVEHIDRRGGIYYRRWGDAPIKTMAVTLLVARNETHHFSDVAYKHDIYTNKGRNKHP